MKLFQFFFIMMFVLMINFAHAELPLSVDLKLYEAYVDNLFQTSAPNSDYVTLMNLDTSYNINPTTSVAYSFDVNLFKEYPDLHNQFHYLSVDHEKTISDERGVIYFGGRLGLRDNDAEYDYYDYRAAGAYSSLKYYLMQTVLAQIEYKMEYENHYNYHDISSFENYGSIQLSKFFNTKTTLQARLEAGRRDYANLDSNVTSLTGSLKVAQSLTDLTGIQLQYNWHHAPKSFPSLFYLQNDDYHVEDPDDEYSYSGTQWQLSLKHYAPWNLMLKGTLSRENRLYNISTIDTERNDTSTIISLEIEKKLLSKNAFLYGTSLHVEFLHKSTSSNDPYYQSSTNIITVGTGISF
jgi:hypothetical protein